jgi:hypothetical protein
MVSSTSNPGKEWIGKSTHNDISNNIGLKAQAVRNYETLSENACSTVPKKYQLVGKADIVERIRGTTTLDSGFVRVFLERFLAIHLPLLHDDRQKLISEEFGRRGFREMGKAAREKDEKEKLSSPFVTWISATLFGSLISIPMIIVTNNPTLGFAIGTTLISTVVFAYVLASVVRGIEQKDVLTGTIAYAGVLVVFVGAIIGATLSAS